MNWRFQWLYRLGFAVLLAGVLWAVWANAQGVTNAPAAAGTNAL